VRFVARTFAETDRLGEFPELGHVGIVPGTYEWTVPGLPYVIVHERAADKDEVIILGVFHGARDR
jgi:toxin ParE1/3/4